MLIRGLLALAHAALAPGETLVPRVLAQLLGTFAGVACLCGLLFWGVALAGRNAR